MIRIEISGKYFDITKSPEQEDHRIKLLLVEKGQKPIDLELSTTSNLTQENCFDADKADALLTAIKKNEKAAQFNELFSKAETRHGSSECSVSIGSYFADGGQYDIVFYPGSNPSESGVCVSDTAKRLTPQNIALGFGALFGAASLTMTLGTAYSCNFLLGIAAATGGLVATGIPVLGLALLAAATILITAALVDKYAFQGKIASTFAQKIFGNSTTPSTLITVDEETHTESLREEEDSDDQSGTESHTLFSA